MIKIGILGDIGSGKSYVAQNFGYPIFNADYEVAKIYKQNKNKYIDNKKSVGITYSYVRKCKKEQ